MPPQLYTFQRCHRGYSCKYDNHQKRYERRPPHKAAGCLHNVHAEDPCDQSQRDVNERQHSNQDRKFILSGALIALIHTDGTREDPEAVDQEFVKVFRAFQYELELVRERDSVPLLNHQEVVKVIFEVKRQVLAQARHMLFEGVQLPPVAVKIIVKLVELLGGLGSSYLVKAELFGCFIELV